MGSQIRKLLLCPFVAALLCGCDGGGNQAVTSVRGKLVNDGKPVKVDLGGANLPPGEGVGRMSLEFYAVESEDTPLVDENGASLGVTSYAADLDADGSFLVVGPTGNGLPAGKYRVVITHIDPETLQDVLKGQFNEANSKIHKDISGDAAELVIDLSKPGG